ncbi:MAG TPA: M20/M25/M40 family metallo-hydrolase, partial [Arthrobacter sp.]|nr:M20/M25/M40 family metallo-hydrolase [Arthrobacter sp.]
YRPTVNDDAETAYLQRTLTDLFGADRVVEADNPLMGSEDFSCVLEEVPGSFYMLHATPTGIDPETAAVNHSPHVQFDDAVLADQAASLAALAFAHNASGH